MRRIAALAGVLLLAACAGNSGSLPRFAADGLPLPLGDTSVVITWDHQLLQAVRDTKPAPTVVARALAVVHTAEYEAWAPYDRVAMGTRLGRALRRPAAEATLRNEETAVSFAAYRALVDLFPSERALFDGQMRAFGLDPADTALSYAPAGVGNIAANAVLTYRHADGSNQLGDLHPGAYTDYSGYVPANTPTTLVDPSRWQPLLVTALNGVTSAQVFTTPFWGRVVPFALPSGSAVRPGPPALYGGAEYAQQAQEIVDLSAGLTDTQKAIAEYWMDGPNSELPPGHWCLFADFVGQRDRHGLADDVKMLFALANAEFDASIAVWDAKRAYDSERPVTAIHALYAGKTISAWAGPGLGTRPIDGARWEPYQPSYVITPPFAEYVSGHSAFSTAAAEILKDYTGSDTFGYTHLVPLGSSKVEPGRTPAVGLTFTYDTFTQAADEAGMSRRYGGIHFSAGDLVSRDLGRRVGSLVWAKALTYFNGTASPPQP